MQCQKEKKDHCQYCKENNSVLLEIMRHIKQSSKPLNSASLPPEASIDTPSTLWIIFSLGMVDDTLVSMACAEAETMFQLTVRTPGKMTEAARIDTLDRINGNGSADYEPLLLSDFTEPAETAPSTSNGLESTALVDPCFTPNTN
nr:PREDICTED: uncharacterized protein LOC106702272 [Latimeria chalumnae]|eukprot:XP_014339908.1 PREDICTED: uncharacterized protein LOC106702272 [Latimeria chalumnae]